MTRKDYKLIANALASARNSVNLTPLSAELYQEIVRRLADSLANDNTAFNRSRFLEAAGGTL